MTRPPPTVVPWPGNVRNPRSTNRSPGISATARSRRMRAKPVVPGRSGYLMVGQDGGTFAFGDVAFHGSLGANPPASPVVSVALVG